MKRATVLCIAMLTLIAHAPQAASALIVGAGVESCGTWTKERREDNRFGWSQTSNWVFGYLSGVFNGLGATPDPMRSLPTGTAADAVKGWLDKYCADNPLDTIDKAAFALAFELLQRSRK